MKSNILILASTVVLLSACEKDDFELQPHDENRMMTVMHQSMQRNDTMTVTNDPDIDFAKMMKMHHAVAIDMADVEKSEGDNTEMKDMAQMMINEQQQEIQQFNAFLSTAGVNNSVPAFHMELMKIMEKMERSADVQLITGDIDEDFAALMIPHHQSAVEMAEEYLKYGTEPVLRTMAMAIIESQEEEIMELQEWLIKNRMK